MPYKDKVLAWTDLETTGIEDPAILEIAVKITNIDLEVISEMDCAVLDDHHPLVRGKSDPISALKALCDDFVLNMHESSGLWNRVRDDAIPIQEVERRVLSMIHGAKALYDDPDSVVVCMAGSGVERFDRILVGERMPMLDSVLYYASMDVSSIRNFLIDLSPELMTEEVRDHVFTPVPHRAEPDIAHHMRSAELIRDMLRQEA